MASVFAAVVANPIGEGYVREESCQKWRLSMTKRTERQVTAASHFYYFSVGAGTWTGEFRFRVTSWRNLLRARVGLKNLILVGAMHLTQLLTGASSLDSTIVPKPSEGTFGVAENTVALSKFGITLYFLRERYVLDPDGVHVTVEAAERFTPIPGILTRSFTYPAEIRDSGMASTYYMPLLGAEWTAAYQVRDSLKELNGELVCDWAVASERARKVSRGR